MVKRNTYRTLDVSSASMVSDPGTQSSSLKGPGLLKALYKCLLQSQHLAISFPSYGKNALPSCTRRACSWFKGRHGERLVDIKYVRLMFACLAPFAGQKFLRQVVLWFIN